jgi:hypothetical protein
MTLVTRDTMRTAQDPLSNGCAQCGDVLVASEWSEHVSRAQHSAFVGLR